MKWSFLVAAAVVAVEAVMVVVAAMVVAAVAAVASVVRNSHGFPCQEKLFSMNIEKALQRTMNRNCVKSTFARSLACSLKPFIHLLS